MRNQAQALRIVYQQEASPLVKTEVKQELQQQPDRYASDRDRQIAIQQQQMNF